MSKTRILAVDYGYKRMGVAISDPLKIIASSLDTVEGSQDPERASNTIFALLAGLKKDKGYEVERIIVGLPLNMNGTDSERTTAARAFAKSLEAKTALPVILFDERLTTVQADRVLREVQFTRKKRASIVDRVSAVILLQTYLST